jgi:hypothetical protein
MQNENEKKITPLSVIDGKSLLALECEPPKFIISRILPTGLSLLSGSPKVGKSWLALWLSNQISKGLPVWEFATQKSAVLYLALEDTVDRLHFRLSDFTEDGSEDSYLTTTADSISGDLIAQLEQFISDKPETGLIIIDTLQRIRGNADENRSGYAFDYEDMNKIKAVADKLNIAILLVHHTRKLPDSDPFNTVSGSTGLTGSCDTMFVLEKPKRAENKGVLHITGRDVEDMQINLEFDRERKIWQFISFATGGENPAEKLTTALAEFLTERKTFTGTATELITALKTITVTPNVLSRMLKEHVLDLENTHKIKVSFTRNKKTRIINLVMNDGDGHFTPTPTTEPTPCINQSSPSPTQGGKGAENE